MSREIELWGLWSDVENRWYCPSRVGEGRHLWDDKLAAIHEIQRTPQLNTFYARRYFPPEPEPPQHPLLAYVNVIREVAEAHRILAPQNAERLVHLAESTVAREADLRAMLGECVLYIELTPRTPVSPSRDYAEEERWDRMRKVIVGAKKLLKAE